MKVLVTGGAGFIGSHLTKALLNKGVNVIVYDNFSSGSMEKLESIKSKITIIKDDIRNHETLSKALAKTDYVFHLAALTSVHNSIFDPMDTFDINANGTLNVLYHSHQAGVKRVVIASSCAIYGNQTLCPIPEDAKPLLRSPYATSKLVGETYADNFYNVYSLETVCLRYFNVYGPDQNADSDYASVIPRFIKAVKSNTPPQIYGTGKQSRDFIYVQDVVRANFQAAFELKDLKKQRIFNIGTGKATSLLDLVEALSTISGVKMKPQFYEARKGDIESSCAEMTTSKQVLGFNSKTSLEAGLKELYTNKLFV
jgi:UDP-glucose 4-epimerase